MKLQSRRFLNATILTAGSMLLLPACNSTADQTVVAQNPAPTSTTAPKAEGTLVAATTKRILPRALWVWDATAITNPEQQKSLFDFCKLKGITIIYLSVGDIFSPTKREVSDPKHVTAAALGKFLKAAHQNKFEVEALDGDPSFALKEQHANALARFQKALDYNKAAAPDERLDGFQWDTEPYILKEFQKDQESMRSILKQYLDSVAEMCAAAKAGPPMRLGYAIPAFFDNEDRAVEWNGSTKPPAFHLMDQLNALPSAYIAIMAYRDKALGSNGTIAISTGEVDYATKSAPKVKVWIGQETLDVTGDPPSITFWQEGENTLEYALGQIETAFKDKSVVGGISIHHWASYRILKPGDPIVVPVITEALTIIKPKANEAAPRTLSVEGTAKESEGTKIVVSVKPENDIWYEQGSTPIAPDGTWGVSCRLGNEATPAGRIFDVRAQLLKADGTVVTERITRVKTE